MIKPLGHVCGSNMKYLRYIGIFIADAASEPEASEQVSTSCCGASEPEASERSSSLIYAERGF